MFLLQSILQNLTAVVAVELAVAPAVAPRRPATLPIIPSPVTGDGTSVNAAGRCLVLAVVLPALPLRVSARARERRARTRQETPATL